MSLSVSITECILSGTFTHPRTEPYLHALQMFQIFQWFGAIRLFLLFVVA